MRALVLWVLVGVVAIVAACGGGKPPMEPDDVNPLLQLPDAGDLD